MKFSIQTDNVSDEIQRLHNLGAIVTFVGKDYVEYTFPTRGQAIIHEEVQNAFNRNIPMFPPGYKY